MIFELLYRETKYYLLRNGLLARIISPNGAVTLSGTLCWRVLFFGDGWIPERCEYYWWNEWAEINFVNGTRLKEEVRTQFGTTCDIFSRLLKSSAKPLKVVQNSFLDASMIIKEHSNSNPTDLHHSQFIIFKNSS